MYGIQPIITNPINPLDPIDKMTKAEKAAAEKLILEADTRVGKGLLNTPLERDLLHHWIEGSGSRYELDPKYLTTIENHPNAEAVIDEISSNGAPNPDVATMVTLANGEQGYKAILDLSGIDNQLDGSLGRAEVYFNQWGRVVGVLDSYDFSNDNLFVDGINLVGARVGAKNFEVRVGLLEANVKANVPDGPSLLDATGNLAERAATKAVEQAGNAWNNAKDGVNDLVDGLPPRYPRFPSPWG